MKKVITLSLIYHFLCYVSLAASHFMKSQAVMNSAALLDYVGAVMWPMALAGAAFVFSLRDETTVVKHYPSAAAAVGGAGLARGFLYAAATAKTGFDKMAAAFAGAMKPLVISFILLTMWFIIFEVSRMLMTKSTKYNKKPRKKS